MPTVPMPTASQRKLVRDSFDLIRPQMRPVSLLFYGRLFELDPAARRLFHIDIAVQGRKLMDTLDAVAASIDRIESMEGRLIELGRQHANYGVRPEQYDTVMSALLWAFTQALGAQRRDVLRLILGHSLAWALAGVVVGVAGAVALLRLLGSLLYGVTAADPWVLGTVSLILLAVAVAASYVPARRAMQVDAVSALRQS